MHARILIVDDCRLSCKLLQTYLMSFDTDTAHDGFEAIKKLSECKYDLVLLDVNLPYLSGITVTKIIETRYVGDEPIIIGIIADDREATRQACIEAGMNDVLSKPIDTQQLIALIKNYLNLS